MSAPRRFDHTAARRLHRQGVSYSEIARRFGVTHGAIRRVCDPGVRLAMAETTARQQRSTCSICGQPCSWNRYLQERPRCRDCANDAQRTSVRPTTLRCYGCKEWKHDSEFPWSRAKKCEGRRGRHPHCRDCQTVAKRKWRERHPAVCERCAGPCTPDSKKGKPARVCRACIWDLIRKYANGKPGVLTLGELLAAEREDQERSAA